MGIKGIENLINEESPRRLKSCVENWPDCQDGEYNPKCCRFPKVCSCMTYDRTTIKESDLE